jgi:hypothetical protein
VGPATYAVDGKILSLLDDTPNSVTAPFQCEPQVGGTKGEWQPELKDGEWANIIVGTIEPVYSNGVLGREPTGHTLAIRRGKMGWNVPVPDAGALIELSVRSTPQS